MARCYTNIQYGYSRLVDKGLLTLPKQFLGPTENGWRTARRSFSYFGSPSHRSGTYLSWSRKLEEEWYALHWWMPTPIYMSRVALAKCIHHLKKQVDTAKQKFPHILRHENPINRRATGESPPWQNHRHSWIDPEALTDTRIQVFQSLQFEEAEIIGGGERGT